MNTIVEWDILPSLQASENQPLIVINNQWLRETDASGIMFFYYQLPNYEL